MALNKAELAGGPGTGAKPRAAGGAGGTLAASGVSVASDSDLGGDTQSAGGFAHSVASDAESGGSPGDGSFNWSRWLCLTTGKAMNPSFTCRRGRVSG